MVFFSIHLSGLFFIHACVPSSAFAYSTASSCLFSFYHSKEGAEAQVAATGQAGSRCSGNKGKRKGIHTTALAAFALPREGLPTRLARRKTELRDHMTEENGQITSPGLTTVPTHMRRDVWPGRLVKLHMSHSQSISQSRLLGSLALVRFGLPLS